LIKEAIKEKVNGIIITLAYTGQENDFIKKVIKIVEENKGKVCLIKLNCNLDKLNKRLSNRDRKKFDKIITNKKLIEWLEKYDDELVYPYKKSLIIDTSKLSSKECSKKILNYCRKV
tara:strand:- start:2938 stop:3288 length:351 start_codon:yes stop_codon:yes gene_type:complete